MDLYPLKFEPIFKSRIWGGRKLASYFGKPLPPGEKIGESWERADLPEDKSLITNGPLAGKTIADALQKYPQQMLNQPQYTPPFPLLIKFLDANDILSVQVHPDQQTCEKMHAGQPKTECWYIIDAQPGSFIYKGVKNNTTPNQFKQAIDAGTVEDLLVKVPVEKGQCHYLPSGTAHAIGAGLLIAEIQQPSDTTYRVYDFNRKDPDGKPRQLHIDHALASIHFHQTPDQLPITTVGRLVTSPHFIIDKGHNIKGSQHLLSGPNPRVLIILDGAACLIHNDAEAACKKGDTVFIPAQLETVLKLQAETEYLLITIPPQK